jgi:isoquinoline 1-oxidoreductase beta subunit
VRISAFAERFSAQQEVAAMAVTRRAFVTTSASAGAALVIGFSLRRDFLAAPAAAAGPGPKPAPVNPFEAWVHVGEDNGVKLIVAKSEMGQGIKTTLPMILADELEVDWQTVEIQQAETRPDIYPHLGTGGSTSVRTTYMDLRRAGATAREMLISAAASQWNVPRERCFAKSGAVIDRTTNQSLKYGSLVAAAAKLAMPAEDDVQLKDPKDFKIIGRSLPRVEIPSKTDGTAEFGLDAKVPGMLYAVVARCATFGGKVKSFDAAAAKAVPGVKDVFQIEAVAEDVHSAGGVAVVADNTWAAMQGRRALKIDWDLGTHADESTASLAASFEEKAKSAGTVVRNDGDVDKLPEGSLTRVEAIYELPFLAHATMEPMNITVAPGADRWESWAPTQSPQWVQSSIAKIAGVQPQKVIVHTLFSGGAFGRRYMADFPVEAAQIAKVVGKPIKLVWTREDDMTHDFYRPAAYHHMTGAVDAQGKPVAWRHHLLSTSINALWDPKAPPHKSEMDGASGVPYNIPNLRVEYSNAPTGVPVAWWRSVADAMNAFAVESFIDELAATAKADPVQFRLQLLEPERMLKDPNAAPDDDERLSTARLKRVLQAAAEKSGWGKPLPKGRARGVACHFSFGSYVAQVAEVSANADGSPKVHRVVSAVDCGVVINPNGAETQSEGAIAYGLSAALYGAITIKNGAVEQRNFDGYQVLRMSDMPEIEVHLVPSGDAPGGLGEPGTPPIAPAVANAMFALTGKRLRKLPFVAST